MTVSDSYTPGQDSRFVFYVAEMVTPVIFLKRILITIIHPTFVKMSFLMEISFAKHSFLFFINI